MPNSNKIQFLIVFLISGFLLPTSVNCQSSEEKNTWLLLDQLKNGVLIVRLAERTQLYEALEERGDDESLLEVKEEDKVLNLQTTKGFDEYFNFCQVYFIKPRDSKYIKEKQYDSIQFLSSELLPLDSIEISPDTFVLTAEFARVDQSQVVHNEGEFMYTTEQGNIETSTTYNRFEYTFPALIIKDRWFIQMERPFPFYQKTLETVPFLERSRSRVIELLDEKLFYNWEKYG